MREVSQRSIGLVGVLLVFVWRLRVEGDRGGPSTGKKAMETDETREHGFCSGDELGLAYHLAEFIAPLDFIGAYVLHRIVDLVHQQG